MGRIQKGILGGFQGTVGTVEGSSWKGIQVMKSKKTKTKRPPTDKQLVQRDKFSLVLKFISSFGKLTSICFSNPAEQMTGRNLAFQYSIKNAVTGAFPNIAIDYSKVLLSKGNLQNAVSPTVTSAGGGIVKFGWGDNSGIPMANADDKCVMALYCPELHKAVYTWDGATRHTGAATINAGIFLGKTVETWIAFISADGKEPSASVFTGQLVV